MERVDQQASIPYGNSYFYQEKWCESEEERLSAIDAWEDFLKELDAEGHETMKKLVSKLEENIPFEQMLRETWHHFRGKPVLEHILRKMGGERESGEFVMRERGVDLELELKNERFKVKTMNVEGSGVVEEAHDNK